MIESTRRGFITGLVAFVAAPAIVKASSIMPVRSQKVLAFTEYYNNRVIRSYMDIEAIRDINVLWSVCSYRGMPIRIVENLSAH